MRTLSTLLLSTLLLQSKASTASVVIVINSTSSSSSSSSIRLRILPAHISMGHIHQMRHLILGKFLPRPRGPGFVKFKRVQLPPGRDRSQNGMAQRPTPSPRLAHDHVGTQFEVPTDHAGIQFVHDLGPMRQRSGPQFGCRLQQVDESVSLVVPAPHDGSKGLSNKIVVWEAPVAIPKVVSRLGIDEIERVEGFENHNERAGFDDGCGGQDAFWIVGSIHVVPINVVVIVVVAAVVVVAVVVVAASVLVFVI